MKKIVLIISTLVFAANNANAQLSVYSNGYVGIATSSASTPESTFSVRGSMTGYDASVKGTRRGIYGESNGQYLNWSYGVYGKSLCTSASFQNGVAGIAEIKTPQSSGRTYGVIGIAGNATNGWNYGIYGQLNGTNNGAGVYGTATASENGSCVDGRYAGYFNGATKVKGNLTVTGSINGIVLSQASSKGVSTISEEYERASIVDKLSKLSTTCYYTGTSTEKANIVEYTSDSVYTSVSVEATDEIEALSSERMHYGLDVEQLKESFPELVYEQENGTIGVNYMEMIPILVQAINNLKTEIKVLKAERPTSNTTTVILGTDGKVIGTKRTISQ